MRSNTIKTKFQTNIEKKRFFKFFRKDIFCVEFFSIQHIKVWRWHFSDIESYGPERNVKLKKTPFFYTIVSRILLWRNHCGESLLKATIGSHKYAVCFNTNNSLSKVYFTLTMLTNYYSAELQEAVFTLALSSSFVLSYQNYVAGTHFGIARKSKNSVLYLSSC